MRWIPAMKAYFIINEDVYSDEAKVITTLNKMSIGRGGTFAEGWCCACSACHGTLFPFSFRAPTCGCTPNHCRHHMQARPCHKRCGHVIGLGPYRLSMTSCPTPQWQYQASLPFISTLHLLISAPFAIHRRFPWTLLLIHHWTITLA